MSIKRYIWMFVMFLAVFSALERAWGAGSSYGLSDFYRFYESVLFYFSGQNIYSPIIIKLVTGTYLKVRANLNLPFVMLLLLPFHVFNYANAIFVWNVISMVCLMVGGYLALQPFPQWHKHRLPILVLFFIFYPTVQSLVYGQVTGILLVVLTLAWLFGRENKDTAAGVCIGVACALKLFCGLFLIYFLCIKRYRVLTVALLSFLISIVASGVVFGFDSYLSFYQSVTGVSWYAVGWNASLKGYLARVFTSVENNMPLYDAPALANYLYWGLSGLIAASVIGLWRTQDKDQFDRGFALAMVSMLLLSPLSWIYYFPLLFIPYLIVVAQKNDWVHLAACFLLLFSTKITGVMPPEAITTPVQVLWECGLGFYVLVGFFVLLVKPHAECERFSPRLWTVIYGLIFLPALAGLLIYVFSITFAIHHLGAF